MGKGSLEQTTLAYILHHSLQREKMKLSLISDLLFVPLSHVGHELVGEADLEEQFPSASRKDIAYKSPCNYLTTLLNLGTLSFQ